MRCSTGVCSKMIKCLVRGHAHDDLAPRRIQSMRTVPKQHGQAIMIKEQFNCWLKWLKPQ